MLAKLKHVLPTHDDENARLHRQLLHLEARLGGRLFGPIANGSRREFFCLDEYTWVWHEEWRDQTGYVHRVMTRYDVRPHGIRKAQDNQPYQYITASEAQHLYAAIDLYNQIIDAELAAVYAEPAV